MTDSEMFVSHLVRVFEVEPERYLVESHLPGRPGMGCLFFSNVPERGLLSAVTYGLSQASHPRWKLGKPELIISLRTTDKSWGRAVAYLAEQHRFEWAFTYGTTIDFHRPISDETEMSAFFIFAPALLEREAFLGIQLQTTIVNIAGVYPMYKGEIPLVQAIGFEAFWHLPDLDVLNVRRPDLSQNPENWRGAKPQA